MKNKLFVIISVLVVLLFTNVNCKAQKSTVLTGIDVLQQNGFKQLKGKKVGLVTNPTGVNKNLVSTVDILFGAKDVQLVALYGPEHGVRGDVHAGDKVEGNIDPKTGLTAHSLYGKTRKPTAEMLKGLDAIVYDIQDNGCRSYTYISTMGKIMEAAAENNIEVIILDRPNPLSGLKVEGSIVEEGFLSFVSQFKIPYIYGLTCGELATMLNEEGMIKDECGKVLKCKLTVVPMKGWKRNMFFEETNLPWVLPSPHVPQIQSSYYYPATGILGELGIYSIGVGYTLPFQLIATEGIDADKLSDSLNSMKIDGVKFRPINIKPFYGLGLGKNLQGVQIYIVNKALAPITEIQFYVMEAIAAMYPEKAAFKIAPENRYRMFDIVTGSDYYRTTFAKRHKWSDAKQRWNKDNESFKKFSSKYYIYN